MNEHKAAWGLPLRAALLAGWLAAAWGGAELFVPQASPADAADRRIGFGVTAGALLLSLAASSLFHRPGDGLRSLWLGTGLRVGIPFLAAVALACENEVRAHAAFGWMTAFFLWGLPVEVWLSLPKAERVRKKRPSESGPTCESGLKPPDAEPPQR